MSLRSTIVVGNLPLSTTREQVEYDFEDFGPIVSIILKRCKKTTFAFVQFETRRQATKAYITTDGYRKVKFALDEQGTECEDQPYAGCRPAQKRRLEEDARLPAAKKQC